MPIQVESSRCYYINNIHCYYTGFHQKCHTPPIPASALQLESPWKCSYCQRGTKCPFITESLDVLQNLLSDDNETTTGDEEEGPMESEYTESGKEESSPSRRREKKRKVLNLNEFCTSYLNSWVLFTDDIVGGCY